VNSNPALQLQPAHVTPQTLVFELPSATDASQRVLVTDVDIRGVRRAKAGRAIHRIGKGREYVAHDRPWGAAAARRRRQMANRGLVGCDACGEPTAVPRLYVVTTKDEPPQLRRVCQECLAAAGIPLPHDEPSAVQAEEQ
jgi:hypothetical protein